MSVITPPYLPTFGSGAPGAGVNTSMPYYDTSVTPFKPYVYRGGAWHDASGSGSSNATSIGGVPVDLTGLANGNFLKYNGTDWVPGTPSSGGSFIPGVEFITLGTGPNTFTIADTTNFALMIGAVSGAHTIKLPASPTDKQLVVVANPTSTNLGSNITLSANTGQTIRNSGKSIISFSQFQFYAYVYDLANTQWNNWGSTTS